MFVYVYFRYSFLVIIVLSSVVLSAEDIGLSRVEVFIFGVRSSSSVD